ncbi:hypothetical protein KPL71_021582 [Citrus sinensis]|uniref:Uncharacterized protein n=1 Tax=Citrus sinensis TaxID=2711 RepID=A0ACB8JIQ3_CITSI|nr:hypothetical protein KPL71_021582 [Citrus sinensis]
MHQFTAHTVAHSSTHSSTIDDQTSDSNLAVSDSHTETDTESSASTSDSEKSYADITKILMAQPDQPTQGQTSHTKPYVDIPSEVEEEMPESSATNQPSPAQAQTNPPSQKSSNGPWFTFDDLPSHKWRDRLNEMSAWIDLQMLRPGATTQSVLREFATRFTEVSSALVVLHDQFLGDPSAVFEAARRDYLNMKCCSLNAKDLDFHYKRMSLLFYKLNGFNEPTLEHVFLASLLEELQPDIQRQLTASNLALDNISLGKIFQLAKTCLDKLCEQKQFFKELLKDKEPFRSAYFRRRENFSFMASTSSSTLSNPVTLSYTLSLPKSCSSHTANKTENLVEYSYIPESAQISESSYPLISPYQLYKRPSSFTCSIRTLISTRRPHPKEYIQSSRLDQCSLQATPVEQYVTLEIPSELISNWKREGYTHLHLCGIRLILTLHGRKGLPVTARISMIDTRFKQYQDAVIGTVLTTLHAGSVLLTFYPNFNLSLQDPNLPTTLKVQVQIQGAEQISSAKIATLHHQLVYRLQNHALDLPTPEHHSDTLMVLAESDQIPIIIQIPRQIPRHELIKLMPLEWISNYEQFHNNTAPIQTSESMFERRQDGTVRMTFKPPPSGMALIP